MVPENLKAGMKIHFMYEPGGSKKSLWFQCVVAKVKADSFDGGYSCHSEDGVTWTRTDAIDKTYIFDNVVPDTLHLAEVD